MTFGAEFPLGSRVAIPTPTVQKIYSQNGTALELIVPISIPFDWVFFITFFSYFEPLELFFVRKYLNPHTILYKNVKVTLLDLNECLNMNEHSYKKFFLK